jgi:hypothetical protein
MTPGEFLHYLPGIFMGAFFAYCFTRIFIEQKFNTMLSGICSSLKSCLETDRRERNLDNVASDFGRSMWTDEQWLEEFFKRLKAGEIEIKWVVKSKPKSERIIIYPP